MSDRISGRIDVHTLHLLPGIDDGCKTVEDSIACARVLVENGYTHAFCTPHIWPSYPHITRSAIPQWTTALQHALDAADVDLTLVPGGEMSLHPKITGAGSDYLVSYALRGRYALIDIWCDECPAFFESALAWLQGQGLTVILAHPERMRAVQFDPGLMDRFADLGLLFQGNLQCFGDPPDAPTRQLAERFLQEGRYFLLGSDTHNPQSMEIRMRGLARAIEIAEEVVVDRLTRENPRELL